MALPTALLLLSSTPATPHVRVGLFRLNGNHTGIHQGEIAELLPKASSVHHQLWNISNQCFLLLPHTLLLKALCIPLIRPGMPANPADDWHPDYPDQPGVPAGKVVQRPGNGLTGSAGWPGSTCLPGR